MDDALKPCIHSSKNSSVKCGSLAASFSLTPPFSRADAKAIKTPTLFIGGAKTKGMLPLVLHTLAAHLEGSRTAMIEGATHPMFEQQPQRFCQIVLDFLGA